MITVTGNKGFIGSYLDFDYDGIDLKDGQNIFSLEKVGETIVHLAAISSIPESVVFPELTWKTNIMGLSHIIELCKQNKSRLIFASSASVLDPRSPYAYSKLWGEEMIKMSGIDYVILRFGNVYGDGDTKSAIYHFQNDEEITIYGNGSISRSFVHVKDVTAAIKASVDWAQGTYNISHERFTILQVAQMFNKTIHYADPKAWDSQNLVIQSDWPSRIRLQEWVNA